MNDLKDMMDTAFNLIRNTPIIPTIELTTTIKCGLLGIMKSYGLSFKSYSRADWEWVELCEGKESPGLMAEEIKARPFNQDGFKEAEEEVRRVLAEAAKPVEEKPPEKECEEEEERTPPFGWLSPGGDFIESPWGTHEKSAEDIITQNGWDEEYSKSRGYGASYAICGTAGDFLYLVKGYVLIHRPAVYGRIQVSGKEIMTRRQKEFLYDYFINRGDRRRAEEYLNS